MGWAALLSLRGGGPRSRSRGPGHTAAAVTVQRLRRAASTVGGLCCSVWDLPESGTEPTSPALADRLLTTEPPGKPSTITFFKSKLPTSSLPLFQDKLLQTSAAHTHAFPHSGQHSVGTWILNRYCTFPYSFLAFKKNKKHFLHVSQHLESGMRCGLVSVEYVKGQRILFCWWKDFHRLSDLVLRYVKSGEWAVVCPGPLDWTLCHVFKISLETKPSIRVKAFPFPEVLSGWW